MSALSSACATWPDNPVVPINFPAELPASNDFSGWASNNKVDALVDENMSDESMLIAAEQAFWRGYFEDAFDIYGAFLRENITHPLAFVAAARVYEMRDDVVSFSARVSTILESLSINDAAPLTRLNIARLGQAMALYRWYDDYEAHPFEAHQWGLPTQWRVSPMMSPWRLLDFDRRFDIETQTSLSERYLSPQIAADVAANYHRTTPYMSQTIGNNPRLRQSGIYYLETFITVSADPNQPGKARDYWVQADFSPSAVAWINGEEIFRYEEDYRDTPMRIRRVSLSPGTHRVLIKLAYQRDYRDWFEFFMVPVDGKSPHQSELIFSMNRPNKSQVGESKLRSPVFRPSDLSPVWIGPENGANADDLSLYFTALLAYRSGQKAEFDSAWQELMQRYPEFGAGYALKAMQIRTRWDIPAEVRDAESIANIRKLLSIDADNLLGLLRLAQWQDGRAEEREIRQLYERAYQGAVLDDGINHEVKNIKALHAWGEYLEAQQWDILAEDIWRKNLRLAPQDCKSARQLLSLYRARTFYPDLAQITPEFDQCKILQRLDIHGREHLVEARLELARIRALRAPYSSSEQLHYIRSLRENGYVDEANDHLNKAIELIPDALDLWLEKAQFVLAESGLEQASTVLREAMDKNYYHHHLIDVASAMLGEIPLSTLMPRGLEAAMAVVENPSQTVSDVAMQGDDAVYVVDFAARQYYPDGSTQTLTHYVVRVLTKSAIDRFGELDIPRDAQLIQARTIKQDGSVRQPEDMPGKSTLSMPGLAEGDFVEIAYLQFSGAPAINSHIEGMPFYFRMQNISTLHSEYLILGAEDASFIRQNNAPEPETLEIDGQKAVRFLARDNARPRSETHAVSGVEYLPWIRAYRSGVTMDIFEAERRYAADALIDLLVPGKSLYDTVQQWLSVADKTDPARELFYKVTQWVTQPSSTDLRSDANHIYELRRGNPLILLKAVYDIAGIESDIYFVKSKMQAPDIYPVGEFNKYNIAVLRLGKTVGGDIWLFAGGSDSMYGAMHDNLVDQPAVCISCVDEQVSVGRVEALHENWRSVDIDASLTKAGTLQARAAYSYIGTRAESMRRLLRERSDQASREQLFELLAAELIAGSRLVDFSIVAEQDYDAPLILQIQLEREDFGRVGSDGTIVVEQNLFEENLESIFAPLADRTTAIMIGAPRFHRYSMTMRLPEDMTASIGGPVGRSELNGPFGSFSREVALNDNELIIKRSLALDSQRVNVDDYSAFQKWANSVEQSAGVVFKLIASE